MIDARKIELIQGKLSSISEELTDVSFELLREASENGETKRPIEDKKVLQARRAIEKAIRSLDDLNRDEGLYN